MNIVGRAIYKGYDNYHSEKTNKDSLLVKLEDNHDVTIKGRMQANESNVALLKRLNKYDEVEFSGDLYLGKYTSLSIQSLELIQEGINE